MQYKRAHRTTQIESDIAYNVLLLHENSQRKRRKGNKCIMLYVRPHKSGCEINIADDGIRCIFCVFYMKLITVLFLMLEKERSVLFLNPSLIHLSGPYFVIIVSFTRMVGLLVSLAGW